MRAVSRVFSIAVLTAIFTGLSASTACAQPDALQNELKRLAGHWRVGELIENGRAIPKDQMRSWLPGGGVLEIVDLTILFQSPIDGAKSTRSLRLDPTAYPKRIAILDGSQTTGTGIYKFDQEKLVVCISNATAYVPSEFTAPEGSNRTLMILSRFNIGNDEGVPGLNSSLPPRVPQYETPRVEKPVPLPPAQVTPPPNTTPIPPTPVPPTPAVPQIVPGGTTGRVLSDTEVRNMAVGTWRLNDTEGSVDISFNANGTFRTYRYYQSVSNFHTVFTPTPISSGNWSIQNGRLIATVSQSSRADKINQSFVPAVRSISSTDMILVDHLGRVSRAVKIR